ncbi:MAG: hypothetical protein J6Y54_04165 [Lentisphaeria bacterium]|nr:hypothetical protein [Lentisphaeria bacterium]
MKREFIAILTAALSIGALSAAETTAAPETVPQAPAAVKKCGKCKKQQAAKHECKKERCAKSECKGCKKQQTAKHECKKERCAKSE